MKVLRIAVFSMGVCALFSGCVSMGTNVFTAAQYNQMDQLKTLVAQGADVNIKDEFGMTPLYQAACNGNAEMIRFLCEHGGNPNITALFGMSPLFAAIWKGQTDAALALIEKGADVNYVQPGNKFTAIIYCGAFGNARIAEALVQAGADVTAKDNKGKSAQDYAVEYKKDEVLAVLRKAGAPVSYSGNAARDVVSAAISGDRDKVRELVADGVDPNLKDKSGKSLFSYAVENKWPDVAGLLIKKGANVNEKDKDGWTLMMKASLENDRETLRMFEAAGVKLGYAGNKKDDILIAVITGDLTKAKELIAQGADVNGKYRFASPLINYAVYRRDQAMAGLLVEHGADINVKNNNGMSALGGAIKNGDIGMVKYLLGRGAQVEPFMVLLSEGKVSGQEKIDFPEITALIKPEVLRRQMLRAQAAVEAAQAPEDYQKAIAEYNLAKEMAPETPEIYYNLGLIEDKAGAYAEAIKDLQKYLQLSPSAGDAQAVKDMIYKLEYKRDQGRR